MSISTSFDPTVPRWLRAADCHLDDLLAITAEVTDPAAYPMASTVTSEVVVFDGNRVRAIDGDSDRHELEREVAQALSVGPGIVRFAAAFDDLAVIDRATEAFMDIIADQHARGGPAGDHYAKPGANDRIWNALEKLAVRWPAVFADYYANDTIALASHAWLGPNYQMSSQVNVVNPGGEAQQPHRDYHLGFMTDEQSEQYLSHIHRLSGALTLQGAVAHCDMPVETGPTMYLPHSQKYEAGFLAWRRPEFREHFATNRVQLALAKGDIVFFNPMVLHAAGTNRTTDVRRMANLLQVSSAFGRAMEAIDRHAMVRALHPELVARAAAGWSQRSVDNVVAASAEGYAFPTNLDRDQPIGGLAPDSQADIVRRALREGWSAEQLDAALTDYDQRRLTTTP